MSETHPQHPTEQALRDYAVGRLSESESVQIDRHLEHCHRCSDHLTEMSDQPVPLISLIREAGMVRERQPAHEAITMVLNSDQGVSSESFVVNENSERRPDKLKNTFGNYVLTGELGRGGMGVVYRAVDQSLKRQVALKVILAGEHSSKALRDRFRHEAETIARLKHSGIVQIYEVGESDDQPFLALELVEGPNLSEITQGEPQAIRWSVGMVLQLARSIHFAHQNAVIHRDLKPSNILIALDQFADDSSSVDLPTVPPDQRIPLAKITDFGLAKQLDSNLQMTRTGHAMGTPAYMAPEQAAGQMFRTGPATDVHALGVILYELLTGQLPYQTSDAVSTLIAVQESDPLSPREHRREIPRDLATICLKCLMKEPDERYESALALATDLELFLTGEPILARPPGPARRLYQWARFFPQLAITYLVCVICFLLHLSAKHVLAVPFHQSGLGRYSALLLGGWAIAMTALDYLAYRFGRRELSPYMFISLTIIFGTTVFSMDQGPRSGPVPMLFVLIASSILLMPKATMVWFATGSCCLSYSTMATYAQSVSGQGVVRVEEWLGMIGAMVLMGFCTQLVLRRLSNRSLADHASRESWASR
ncbi:MAG: protein kinase [Planctomycetota bacterium]